MKKRPAAAAAAAVAVAAGREEVGAEQIEQVEEEALEQDNQGEARRKLNVIKKRQTNADCVVMCCGT